MRLFRSGYFYLCLALLGIAVTIFCMRKNIVKQLLPEIMKAEISQVAIGNDSIKVNLLFLLKNRMLTSYEVGAIDITVSNDTVTLVHFQNDSTQSLVPNEMKQIELQVYIPLQKIIHQIRSLQGQDSTYIDVKGTFDLKSVFGKSKLPIHERIPIAVPVPPDVTVQEIVYTGKGPKTGQYNFNLKAMVVNKVDKQIHFKDLTYNFKGEKLIESQGALADLNVAPFDTSYFSIPLAIKVNDQMKLAFDILFNKDILNYTFTISGTISSFAGYKKDIPATFVYKGNVELYDPHRKKIKITLAGKKKKK